MERLVGVGQPNIRFGPSFVDHPVISPQVDNVRAILIRQRVCDHVFPIKKLHVTLVELGTVRSVKDLMENQGYLVDQHKVHEGYLWLFEQFRKLPEEPIGVEAESLRTFYQILTIGLSKKRDWMEMRRELTVRVMEMIQRLGISDVRGFIKRHPKLCRLQEEKFDPHLSLGQGYSPRYRKIDVEGMKIMLQPPRLMKCVADNYALLSA